MKHIALFSIILGAVLISACGPAVSLPVSGDTQPGAAPAEVLSTAASEALIPAGWATHSSRQCEYAISYPPEMQATHQSPYSQLFGFPPASGQEATPNFIYVSVVAPEIRSRVAQGAYQNDVYNYDPAAAQNLLDMQVGETRALHPDVNVGAGFTYQRQPDATIGGYAARAYENAQPWEFPAGTKEIRYVVSTDRCTYLVGGYVDTTGANQPGAISEDLFRQVVATVQLMP